MYGFIRVLPVCVAVAALSIAAGSAAAAPMRAAGGGQAAKPT